MTGERKRRIARPSANHPLSLTESQPCLGQESGEIQNNCTFCHLFCRAKWSEQKLMKMNLFLMCFNILEDKNKQGLFCCILHIFTVPHVITVKMVLVLVWFGSMETTLPTRCHQPLHPGHPTENHTFDDHRYLWNEECVYHLHNQHFGSGGGLVQIMIPRQSKANTVDL